MSINFFQSYGLLRISGKQEFEPWTIQALLMH